MFVTDCQACGLRELRGPRSIELLVNTDHGADLVYRCTRCDTVNALRSHPHPHPHPQPAPVAA
jgi:phage FluMu protein Com